jgi:hypothetical protein
MEEKQTTLDVAQIVLISSALTLCIVAGTLFIAREYIISYITEESGLEQSEATETVKVDTREPVVKVVEAVNNAVVSVIVTKDVPILGIF